MDTQSEKRIRTQTMKGAESYEASVEKYINKLSKVKRRLEEDILIYQSKEFDKLSLTSVKVNLEDKLDLYDIISREFLEFLSRTKTFDSENELVSQQLIINSVRDKCAVIISQITKDISDEQSKSKSKSKSSSHSVRIVSHKGSSHRSHSQHHTYDHSSHRSISSSISSIMMRQKAKVMAAHARLEFASKEVELQKQKAEIETNMTLLSAKKEVAVADAELKAMREELEGSNASQSIPEVETQERVQQYVDEHAQQTQNIHATYDYNYMEPPGDQLINIRGNSTHQGQSRILLPGHVQLAQGQAGNNDIDSNIPIGGLSNFLLRKELLVSRLSKFEDKPESFLAWMSTFRSVMTEMKVNASEEIDLLVKWLGQESSRHAVSIRISSASDYKRGLEEIWNRLQERYGNAEMVEASLKRKLVNFPNIGYRDKKRLYDLSDILSEIQSAKRNPNYEKLLSYFDTSAGVNPVVLKLPQNAQGKWRDKATYYKKSHCVSYPPFEFFVNFVHDLATTMNDPGFIYETESSTVQRFDRPISKMRVSTAKTAVADERDTYMPRCVIHKANHSLNECRAFREKSFEDRRKLVREHGLCFKCLNSSDHISRDCKENVPCKECGSNRHATGMHSAPNANPTASDVSQSHGGERQAPHALRSYGGERSANITSQQHQSQRNFVPQSTNPDRHMMSSSMQASREPYNVNSKCTEICKGEFGGKSCAKIVPVNISHSDYPHQRVRIYAIIDEQSNKSLAKKELFDMFSINSEPERYTLSSCAGRTTLSGRRSQGFVVESLDSTSQMNLPTVIECEEIPNNRDEIPTPEIAMHHPHLQSIANKLSPLDAQTDILLLIGRDLMEAHHILEQKLGPLNTPYAQRLRLGWVIVGETCLGGSHVPNAVTTLRTYVTTDGRHSIFKPCDSEIHVREVNTRIPNINLATDDFFGSSIFARTQNDDRPGMSVEDKSFLKLMADHCYKGEDGSWVAPLPFRASRPRLPNNKLSALHRAKNLDSSMKKDPIKREHILVFMQDLLDSGYAELAPRLDPGEECWYLPLFGVYHPKKKDQIRCVFDSSAKFSGISLNDVLLTGPDLINNLVGVLMRFRKERIAVTADIKKMFYCFMVSPEDRNYLRFLWHRDNKLDNDLVDYRMRVHVFGNSPSPAVATYCLRKTAEEAEHIYGSDVKEFVERNFYVDDALSSHHTSSEAVDLLKRTQAALKEHGNIRLHKLSSNSEEVLSAFPPEDLANGLRDLDFQFEALPLQTSLGLTWDIQDDVFKFLTTADNKPFTRRGVLSVVSSIFDPLGLVAPITIQGKLLLRKFMTNGLDWDDTFQAEDYAEWRKWKESLLSLTDLRIPRPYVKASPSQASSCELHVFSDASEKAIAAVSYLRVVDKDGLSHLGFLYGKTKVAPAHGHTIPRLELCAAVMSVQMTDVILEQLDLIIDFVKFYTDSRVVLGYIQNERRRFHVYVGNRVDIIRKSSIPSQWNYVPTHLNPADVGTRSISSSELQASVWLQGPASFLGRGTESEEQETHNLVGPDEDKEVRPANFVMTLKTSVESSDSFTIGTERYKRFSTWKSLVRALALLRRRAVREELRSIEACAACERFIVKSVQSEVYKSEIHSLQNGGCVSKSSRIISLDPYLDNEGILRVGGRLNNMSASLNDKNPFILPGNHHVSTLLVHHHHAKVKHMGRHFTDGAIRSAGIWITGAKRLINSLLHKCVSCRKRRGNVQLQKMADLPQDRLEPAPPFTNVGLDVFGPWPVVARKTRGGQANSKRWAVIFSCLVMRAIHIEVVEEMTSSAFINALRRFIAIRGNVKVFRSDRGTNFVGATQDLRIDAINVEDGQVKDFLFNSGTVWLFNSPHSSHMGGAWERMIGISRKILDSMLCELRSKNLTHDVLVTLMAEVSAVVNARPLVPVSTDSESPFLLTPATLLTMKTDHSVKSFVMEDFSVKDLYKSQWRQVQHLSNTFWSRWRKEYLCSLQGRRKWQTDVPNLRQGDVVLLKDDTAHRNDWPMGIIQNPLLSDDKLVRKAEIRIMKDGKPRVFTRPVTEIVLVLSDSEPQ